MSDPTVLLATAVETEHAALRERAEVAEAKVAAVAMLPGRWISLAAGNESARGHATKVAGYYRKLAAELTAALADRPAAEATTRAPSIGTEPYRGKG